MANLLSKLFVVGALLSASCTDIKNATRNEKSYDYKGLSITAGYVNFPPKKYIIISDKFGGIVTGVDSNFDDHQFDSFTSTNVLINSRLKSFEDKGVLDVAHKLPYKQN